MIRLLFPLIAVLVAIPALAQVSVQSPLSDDRNARPGSTYEGTVLLVNEAAQTQQVRLYLTDYTFGADGRNEFGPAGTTARSNADWVELGPRVISLSPHERLTFGYRVRVPEDLPDPGTYWSMLMVEGIPADAAESTFVDDTGSRRGGISAITRYGIQIATHVADGEADFAFENVAIRGDEDQQVLEIDIANHGNGLATATVTVELFSADGESLWRREGGRTRLYPGTSVRERVNLADLPEGRYEALILIDGGQDVLTGAQYTLDL